MPGTHSPRLAPTCSTESWSWWPYHQATRLLNYCNIDSAGFEWWATMHALEGLGLVDIGQMAYLKISMGSRFGLPVAAGIWCRRSFVSADCWADRRAAT